MFKLCYLTFLKRDCFSHSVFRQTKFPETFFYVYGQRDMFGVFLFIGGLRSPLLIFKTNGFIYRKNFCSVVYFGSELVNLIAFEWTIKTNVDVFSSSIQFHKHNKAPVYSPSQIRINNINVEVTKWNLFIFRTINFIGTRHAMFVSFGQMTFSSFLINTLGP